jgi:hypothetical protein
LNLGSRIIRATTMAAGYAALGAAYIIVFSVATGPSWTQTVAQIAKAP